jgi:hypothetical protein
MRDLSKWITYAAEALADRALVDPAYVPDGALDDWQAELFAADYLSTYFYGWSDLTVTERANAVFTACNGAHRILRDWAERTAELV